MIKCYELHKNVQIYHLISYWYVNMNNGRVPQYGVCFPCGLINTFLYILCTFWYILCTFWYILVKFLIIDIPQNGSVSESLTHTSGHRSVKSTPRVPLVQTVQVDCDHGLHWSIQKCAYFGRNVLIGYSLLRSEKLFADEEHAG